MYALLDGLVSTAPRKQTDVPEEPISKFAVMVFASVNLDKAEDSFVSVIRSLATNSFLFSTYYIQLLTESTEKM